MQTSLSAIKINEFKKKDNKNKTEIAIKHKTLMINKITSIPKDQT